MIDLAALAESLANDPEALAALVNGPQGLPEAVNVALAEEAEAVGVAEAVSTATLDDEWELEVAPLTGRTMQIPGALPAEALSRVDLLV